MNDEEQIIENSNQEIAYEFSPEAIGLPPIEPEVIPPENSGSFVYPQASDIQRLTGSDYYSQFYNPQGYKAAFNSFIGNSTVDLSIPENEQLMKDEYNNWRLLGRKRSWKSLGFPYTSEEFKEQRKKLRNEWYLKYHGMPYEQYRSLKMEANGSSPNSGFYPGANRPLESMKNNFQALSVPGLAYADFTNDALGTVVPGYNKLDDRWDQATQLDNPIHQDIRQILSIVLPAIHTGGKTHSVLAQNQAIQNMPRLQKALVEIGAYGLADGAVTLLSDTSEDHNAARVVSDLIPGLFGSKGILPLPEAWKTKDSQSPAARKAMNFWENSVLSTFGTILGVFLDSRSASKTALDYLEPIDESAKKYKQLELLKVSSNEDLIELQKLNTLLSSKKLNRQTEKQIMDEIMSIEARLGTNGDLDQALKYKEVTSGMEADAAAKRKLSNLDAYEQLDLPIDGDISPGLLDQASEARSVPPPANVARNMADTTAIKNGTSVGDPAPIITEAMREKGLMIGSRSRDAVMGVAEETRDIGRFNAVVDGIRYSAKQMNAAAWDIYTSIIAAENIDDVKQLFVTNKDVKNFLMGRFKVEVFNEEQARAAAFALRDLTDRFLGREVTEASARVMDTLGRESATLAETIQKGGPYIDNARVMDLIIEKMQFLLDEYALNKYLSGWSLRNKNWFDQVPPKELDDVIEQLTKEFTDVENAIHARNLRFTKTLQELKKTKPHFLRPLVDAFAHTNGDVDSLVKLNKWAAQQVSPGGILKSPNPKEMNLFAKSTWAIVMNNVLSGLSAFNAGLGNTFQLVTRPITAFLGHGILGPLDNWKGLKMSIYANGAILETNRRALNDAFEMMKKAHKDPDAMIKAYRKDFQFQNDAKWDIMTEMRDAWAKEGNYGKTLQFDLVDNMRKLSRHPAMRYGMTALVFPDAYTSTMLSHWLSRMRAYDDVFNELGYAKKSSILVAEAQNYKQFFDAEGIIKDDALRAIAGEIQLNLDDGLANWLNKGTTAYPISKFMFMFPRTQSNWVKASASWTPLSLIPGFNKYSKTIYARNADDIAEALAEHGIDMASTPNAQMLFEHLRAEYLGRIAFSSIMVGSLWSYALAGNLRGNGHYNASRRKKERDQFGYEPKTINIGGKWVSYEGFIGVEQVLSIMGDLAYYMNDLNQPLIEDWQAKLMWTLSASFLNNSPFQGFEPLIAATNGDLSGWNRIVANTSRSLIPLSGGLGVVANAIDSAQKDIEGEMWEYLANRLPLFKNELPNQIDIWTGNPLNDIDNPILRGLNAISPIKISGTNEPWRVWLRDVVQYDGISRLRRDSTGAYEYTAQEREYIYTKIGEMELYKEIEALMNSKEFDKELKELKAYRSNNFINKNKALLIRKELLPIHRRIDYILRKAQKRAEQMLLEERPDIAETIYSQGLMNHMMKQGNIKDATKIKDNKQLIQYGGSR